MKPGKPAHKWESVNQKFIKAHGGVPTVIGIKVEPPPGGEVGKRVKDTSYSLKFHPIQIYEKTKEKVGTN